MGRLALRQVKLKRVYQRFKFIPDMTDMCQSIISYFVTEYVFIANYCLLRGKPNICDIDVAKDVDFLINSNASQ